MLGLFETGKRVSEADKALTENLQKLNVDLKAAESIFNQAVTEEQIELAIADLNKIELQIKFLVVRERKKLAVNEWPEFKWLKLQNKMGVKK